MLGRAARDAFRRRALEAAAASWEPPFFVTPATADVGEAREWFETFEGAGMDGVMAKSVLDPYAPGQRTLVKVKHKRTADCVVAGYREHKSGPDAPVSGRSVSIAMD